MIKDIPLDWKEQLSKQGHFAATMVLDDTIKEAVKEKDFKFIDQYFLEQTQQNAPLFQSFKQFYPLKNIEFIISLREAINPWEEDGIWHDDGSRKLAFSLSLTIDHKCVEGGILEIRKKGKKESLKIAPFEFGKIIIFATGIDGFEHKINQVTQGKRLIIAGWCR